MGPKRSADRVAAGCLFALMAGALSARAQPDLVSVDAWVTGPSEAYSIAISGPVSVEPRDVGARPITLRMTFDESIAAVRRAEATSGSASIVGFSPGGTDVIVEVDGVAAAGYSTVTLIDVVGSSGVAGFTDAAIGVSVGDFGTPAGVYDLTDVDAFIGLLRAGDLRADLTLDGLLDMSDTDMFIDRYLNAPPAQGRAPQITPIADAFAPAGGQGRTVRFAVRDDLVSDEDIALITTSSDPSLLPAESVVLSRNGRFVDLRINGPTNANGQATVTVTASNGSQTSERTLAVTVRPDAPPIARFSIDPFLGEAPLPVTFDARASSDVLNNVASYSWSFGDGASATGAVAQHTFASPGSYRVTLTVTDDSGLQSEFDRVVTVATPGFDPSAKPIDRFAAKRFLWQAAFGPTEAEIAAVQAKGYAAWIEEQLFATPPTLFDPDVFQNAIALGYTSDQRGDQFFDDIAAEASDQLRQRVAWALIQIIVMQASTNDNFSPGFNTYYSEYVKAATGNYRDLLEYVTYSPQMGRYLTYSNSSVADPATGSVPDENYAREIKQLFTVGLDIIDERGVPQFNAFGERIEAYDNSAITEFARVFTGMRQQDFPQLLPLRVTVADHDFGEKQLLNYPDAIPEAGLLQASNPSVFSFETDIALTLDNLFHHPNTPPFIAKLLIQRFVTANPTGDYIERVAQAFKGEGAYGNRDRGDIAATITAILLDREARDPVYANNPDFGKPLEPLVAALGLIRATGTVMHPHRPFPLNRITVNRNTASEKFGQGFMNSPSVFNFYLPDFTPPESALDRGGLFAPELQILTTSTSFEGPNQSHAHVFSETDTYELAIAAAGPDPASRIDFMVDQWYHRPINPEIRNRIIDLMDDIGSQGNEIRAAARMLLSNPDFVILR
ncbi:MAG: DUF1800 family protein [Planctomycetota bacterium]